MPVSRGLGAKLVTGTASSASSTSARLSFARANEFVSEALAIVLLLVVWLATHPNKGVIHDARLYAVQALNRLDPRPYSDDLFFAFGSQDSFTIFSWLYDPIIRSLGLTQAHLLGALIGQAAWFASLLFLARTLFDSPRERLLACASVILLDPSYSALRTFQYAEAFTTPRIFAEALVMTAFALFQRRRSVPAVGCLALAGALHPLMALPGVGVAILCAARRSVWWAALGALMISLFAAFAGIEPFTRALSSLDQQWFEVARRRSAHAFLSAWPTLDLLSVSAKAILLAMAWQIASPPERGLLRALLLATGVGLVATLFGADLFGNVLLVNLQPWRVLWLTTIFANAWAAIVVLRLPPDRLSRVALTLALPISAACHLLGAADLSSPLVLAAGALLLFERRNIEPMSSCITTASKGVILLLTSAALALLGLIVVAKSAFPGMRETLLAAAAAMGAAFLLLRPPSSIVWRAVLASALLLIASASFDRRDGWRRFVDDPVISQDLREFTVDAGHLYWDGAVDLTWLKLRRSSHFSCLQGAGAMFFRGTAAEFERRRRALAQVTSLPVDCGAQEMEPVKEVHRADLEAACRNLPELDTLVLAREIEGLATRRWTPPAPLYFVSAGQAARADAFYRYDCNRFR